ncbi:MAG: arsenate reductase (glutaredoxin) [Planktotalea sp.]|uniref:arsenate reductase (glutaredoxin) n=1 Tax=Planktotalea sp. TaxID=2029877 RepID=UPI003C76634E
MITLWHNPRCSKSRQALALLQEAGADVALRLYLKDAPSLAELETLHKALNIPVIKMMRTGEKTFKEAGLGKDADVADLLAAMVAHPILIERPIAVEGDKAVIARPPENALNLL